MNTYSYPRLLRRVQAVLIDSIIFPLGVIGSVYLSGAIVTNETWVKALFLFAPVFILEPFLVSFTGGTIGHHLLKLRVRKIKEDKNINIVVAIVRFFMKIMLGWMSLVLVLITKRHQAIHDYLLSTIVVNKSSESLPHHEALSERIIEEDGFKYPSRFLRLFVISMYWALATIIYMALTNVIQLVDCANRPLCHYGIQAVALILVYTWLFLLAYLVVLGWRSRLYGCRRQVVVSDL